MEILVIVIAWSFGFIALGAMCVFLVKGFVDLFKPGQSKYRLEHRSATLPKNFFELKKGGEVC